MEDSYLENEKTEYYSESDNRGFTVGLILCISIVASVFMLICNVMLSLSIILRNSSIQELADLKNTDTEDKNEKSLLTIISTLTHENVIEYLSSNLDFLLDNNIKDWTLGKYWEQMEIEEFNFLTP